MDAIEDSGIPCIVSVFALIETFPNVKVVEAFLLVGIFPHPTVVAEVSSDEVILIIVLVS